MDNDKKCECCGTINDAHHSAECIDTGGKGYMRPQEPCEADVRLNNLLNARQLKAFDWLAANADDISIEWTGTHNHIYSGSAENLERLGCGRSLLEAVENCLGI